MTPDALSAALRSVAERIGSSESPSRSAVSSALRHILAGLSDQAPEGQQASPSTKVVINENWSEADAREVMAEHGGVSLRQGYLGEFGVEMPADQAAQFEADVGEGAHVFSSWEEASKVSSEADDGEPYEFEIVDDEDSSVRSSERPASST